MIEVVVTHVAGQASRTAGILRLNDEDAAAAPEILQPLDGRTLAVIVAGLRKIAEDQAKAWEEFGNPAQPGGNGGTG
jgi:hypothetical protein